MLSQQDPLLVLAHKTFAVESGTMAKAIISTYFLKVTAIHCSMHKDAPCWEIRHSAAQLLSLQAWQMAAKTREEFCSNEVDVQPGCYLITWSDLDLGCVLKYIMGYAVIPTVIYQGIGVFICLFVYTVLSSARERSIL